MTLRFLGAALALASLISPTIAAAQVADRAGAPSGTAPLQAPCVVQADGTCAAVKASVPLPVTVSTPTGAASDQVQGTAANGSPTAGNPVTVAGSDGTNTRSIRTDSGGNIYAIGANGHNAGINNFMGIGGAASSSAPAAVTTGNGTRAWYGLNGQAAVSITALSGAPIGVNAVNDGQATPIGLDVRSWGVVWNGTNGDRMRDANNASGTTGTGLLGVGNLGFDGTAWRPLLTSNTGQLAITGFVQGTTAAGTTDNGNPNKIGGLASPVKPTDVTQGQRVNAWYTLGGTAVTSQYSSIDNAFVRNSSTNADGLNTDNGSANAMRVASHGLVFNGTTFDRMRDATSANATTGTGLLGAGILGQYTATLPTYTTGQYGTLAMNTRGVLMTRITDDSGAAINAQATNTDNLSTRNALVTLSSGMLYNGASWDRARGDTTGAYVVPKGGPSIATSQTSVGTTAALVAPARVGRNKVTVTIGAANSCALGNAGVTLSTGFPIQPVAGASITLDTAAAIYAVCSATTTVSDIETF